MAALAMASLLGLEAPRIIDDSTMAIPAYCMQNTDDGGARPICTAQQRVFEDQDSLVEFSILCSRQPADASHHVCASLAIMQAEQQVVGSTSQSGLWAAIYRWQHAVAVIVFCIQGVICVWSTVRCRTMAVYIQGVRRARHHDHMQAFGVPRRRLKQLQHRLPPSPMPMPPVLIGGARSKVFKAASSTQLVVDYDPPDSISPS
eukprot:2521813-Amphidinium_carterae.1